MFNWKVGDNYMERQIVSISDYGHIELQLKQYMDNSNINLLFIPKDNSFKIAGLTDVFVQILEAMGFEWLKYYQKRTYTLFLSELCAEGISA